MKKKNITRVTIYVVLCLFIIPFLMQVKMYAHPGNTDSNGGHTCWTNCEKWGLNYGEYHSHDSVRNHRVVIHSPKEENNIIAGIVGVLLFVSFIALAIYGRSVQHKEKEAKKEITTIFDNISKGVFQDQFGKGYYFLEPQKTKNVKERAIRQARTIQPIRISNIDEIKEYILLGFQQSTMSSEYINIFHPYDEIIGAIQIPKKNLHLIADMIKGLCVLTNNNLLITDEYGDHGLNIITEGEHHFNLTKF